MDSDGNKILVEGRFFEINASGKPIDLVWLELTRDELIISEIDNEEQTTKEATGVNVTGKKGSLRLQKALPVKSIQILVIDDRAKRMAVATDKNIITFYEMCKPQNDWVKWEHAADKGDQKPNKHRRSHSQIHVDNVGSVVGRYVTYPVVCHEVTDKGVQTDPLPNLPARKQRGKTYLDELEPIVVQEYQAAMDRVTFCDDEEIFSLCKIKHSVGCLKSSSTTAVEDRKQSRIPRKSSSCCWLWKPPESVHTVEKKKALNRHFCRRELNDEEAVIVEEMLKYRQNQAKSSQVSRKRDTDYTWNWNDGGTEAEVDLNALLEKAKNIIGSDEPQTGGAAPCRHCGQVKRTPPTNPAGIQQPLFMNPNDAREFDAGEIAMQLSVRDRNLLWLFTQSNLTRLALSSAPSSIRRVARCVALEKMAAWAKRIPRLVATEVLDQPSYQSSVEALELFIKVAEFCLIIRNFNSFVNVMRGLQFYSVYRQGIVWQKLQKSDPNICQLYLTMCDKMLNLIFKLQKFGPGKKQLPVKDASIPWFPALLCRLVNEVQHQQQRTDFPKDHLKFHPLRPTHDNSNMKNTHETNNTMKGITAKARFQTIAQQVRQKIVEVRKDDKTSVLGKAYHIIAGDESANQDSKGRERSWLGAVQNQVTKVTHGLPETVRSKLKHVTSRESVANNTTRRRSDESANPDAKGGGSWFGTVQQRVTKVTHDLPETVRSTLKHATPSESTRRRSLLPSNLDFAGIKNRFTKTNKNSNAKEKFCQVCFTKDCHYRGDPGKLLLEVQLSAARYKYISNSTVDAFLTRRPVLSDYALVENFLQDVA